MKFLISIKLSDRSMWNHISPITNLDAIEGITIVRDTPGPTIKKVRYANIMQQPFVSPILNIPVKLAQLIQLICLSLIEKPSLIHSYLLFPYGYLALIAGKLTGRKVGVSLIAGPVETYMLGGSPIGKYAYGRPLPQSNTINSLVLSILKRFDFITVTGTFTRDYLVIRGFDEHKIFVLPHSVDERFRPLDIEKDYDVVFVGRLAKVKHIDTIIRATAQIQKTLPSIHVAIVGDGEERNKLEELAHSLGLDGQIDFIGYQTNTWDWYNRGKISILTSEREGFPYTVIESLKCGVPTVVSDCGDVNDIVKDSFNGRIISDYNDHEAYAKVIVDLLTHPDLIKVYSENCLLTLDGHSSNSVESTWGEIIARALQN